MIEFYNRLATKIIGGIAIGLYTWSYILQGISLTAFIMWVILTISMPAIVVLINRKSS